MSSFIRLLTFLYTNCHLSFSAQQQLTSSSLQSPLSQATTFAGASPQTSSSNSSFSHHHNHTHVKPTSTIQGGLAPFKTTITPSPIPFSFTGTRSWTHTHNPSFTHPHPPPPTSRTPSTSLSQQGWLIFLEAAGALIGIGFAAALGRCFWSYRKTPRQQDGSRQDSIAQIRRELRESRIARALFNRNSQQAPPPPYEYAPEYENESHPNTAQINTSSVTVQGSRRRSTSPTTAASPSAPLVTLLPPTR